MAERTQRQIGPFGGLVTAVDPENIPDGAASDMLNVRIEDGVLRTRYGFRNLDGAPTGFTASRCFEYLQGYNNSYQLVEEYLSIETRSGVTRPYSTNVSTGARTEIKNGITSLSLSALAARSVAYQGYSFVITPGDAFPLYQHMIGDNTSYTLVKVPADPTTAITYTKAVGAGGVPFSTVKWTGMNPATDISGRATHGWIDLTGDGTSKLPNGVGIGDDGSFFFATKYDALEQGAVDQMQIDLRPTNGAADYDMSANDSMTFNISSSSPINGPSIDAAQTFAVYFINAAGKKLYPETPVLSGKTTGQGFSTDLNVACSFSNKTPADWTAIRYIVIQMTAYAVKGALFTNITSADLILSPLTLAGANIAPTHVGDGLVFGYAYMNSAQSWESGIGGVVTVPYDVLKNLNGSGTWLTLNWTASGDGSVDKVALYVQTTDYGNNTKTWRLISQVAVGTTTYSYKLTYQAALALAARSTGISGGTFPTANLVCGCAYKGWMVWGYSGGGGVAGSSGNTPNIRMSQSGQPLKLATNIDPTLINPDNVYRPADFSLADNYSDDPMAMFACGDGLIILGSQGAYEQVGISPATMTPPKRIDGSFGCAGYNACARWRDELGNPAVVYVSANGEGVYLVAADRYYLNQTGFKVSELSLSIRGYLRTYFGADLTGLMVRVDWARDAVYLILGTKALVLRRPSLADGQRHWEPYQWNLAGVANASFNVQRRMRWIRTTGHVDENEWNSSSGSWLSGTLQDGGAAPASLFWTSKKFVGVNRRIDTVRIDRESLTDTPAVTCTSTRETTTKTVLSGKNNLRFGLFQQGVEHTFKLALGDGSGGVRRIVVDEIGPLGRRASS